MLIKEIYLYRKMVLAKFSGKKLKYWWYRRKYKRLIKKGENKVKTIKNILERLKSPVVIGQLILIVAETLKLLGIYEMPNELISDMQDFVTLGFNIFAGLNNPTDKKNF